MAGFYQLQYEDEKGPDTIDPLVSIHFTDDKIEVCNSYASYEVKKEYTHTMKIKFIEKEEEEDY